VSESTRLKNEGLDRARQIAAELEASRGGQEQASGLDAAPDLNQAYQQAGEATQPLEAPTPEPPLERTTSFAKSLDEQPAAAANDAGAEKQGQGSEMVEKDRPELKPVNNSQEAKAVDRSQFNQAWSDEKGRADAVNQRAEQIADELQKAKQQQQEPGQEPSQGMG